MHIILNHSSMVPIYEQLMEQIKSDIIQSELKEGEALPSVRTLAGELRISALTVKKAYDKLAKYNTFGRKRSFKTSSGLPLMTSWKKRDLLQPFMEKERMCQLRINSLHLKQGRKR